MLPWMVCGVLALTALVLAVRLYSLQRDMKALAVEVQRCLADQTNRRLSVGGRQRALRRLAAVLDEALQGLCRQRWRYTQGDSELKEAVVGVCHDLRTPLTALIGYLELAGREDNPPATARYLALIAQRAEALRQRMQELLRYTVVLATAGQIQPRPLDLNAAVETAVAGFYGALVERGILPVIRLPRRRVQCMADPGALARVLDNLLSNALRYSDGDLVIDLAEDGTLCFANAAHRLDAVEVGRLFDRYFSVEAPQDATGLGLAVARTLVQRMDGALTADYADGRLRLSLRLPAAPAADRTAPAAD